jgi:hypothetical protein
VHIKADAALMRGGVHPSFRMLVLKDGVLTPVTLDEWAARIEFTDVDVTGDAAVVRLELHRGGKHTFTDYLSLYRFPDGWKIVSKIFHAHP